MHGLQRRARRSAIEASPVSGVWQRQASEPPAPTPKRSAGLQTAKQGWNDGSGRWNNK